MMQLLRTKRFPLLAIMLMVLIPLGRSLAQETEAQSENVVIVGVPIPLTGRFQDFGLMMQRSFEMAESAINDAGGIKGRPIRLVYGDTEGSPDKAQAVIDQLVDQAGAAMLVGGYQSDVTYGLARFANARDVPLLICTAATDRITEQGWPNVYRLNPPVSEYTASLEDFLLKELHPKSMAVVYEDSMFGTDAAANMMSFLQDNGIEVHNLIGYAAHRADPAYLRPLLAPLTQDPPDVIHMISYLADAVVLVKTLRELEITSQLTGAAAGFAHPEFLTRAGDAAENMLVATLWSGAAPYPGARAYHDSYLSAHGVAPNYHGAEAYSALLVAADALRRAGSLESEAIREALDETFMMTPFGPVKFYSYQDFERQNSVRPQVLRVSNARFEVIWPADLAAAAASTR